MWSFTPVYYNQRQTHTYSTVVNSCLRHLRSVLPSFPPSSVSKKHGKLITFLRTFMKSRPTKQKLKQRGILRERVFGCDLGEHLLNSGHDGEIHSDAPESGRVSSVPLGLCFFKYPTFSNCRQGRNQDLLERWFSNGGMWRHFLWYMRFLSKKVI